jgi:glc operon protein GlcG
MRIRTLGLFLAALGIAPLVAPAHAQVTRPSYGTTITLDAAKKAAAAAVAEAKKNHWAMAIAIVDNHGMLIYYEMDDDTQTAGATIAIEKARTAAIFRRPSKDFSDRIARGENSVLGLRDLRVVGRRRGEVAARTSRRVSDSSGRSRRAGRAGRRTTCPPPGRAARRSRAPTRVRAPG